MNKYKQALKKVLYRLKKVEKISDNIKDIILEKSADRHGKLRYPFYRDFPKNVSDNIKDIFHRKKLEAAMIRGIIFL